jgi:hypothetical protein
MPRSAPAWGSVPVTLATRRRSVRGPCRVDVSSPRAKRAVWESKPISKEDGAAPPPNRVAASNVGGGSTVTSREAAAPTATTVTSVVPGRRP